ncbi:WecB/TagA/CpsF family glycosyltransferase [Candidatus Pelagibacter sp.]|nr:WecB/TagA/CpsF family glycosyltransferase [Candidatus Pelagibacter sp.]
MKIRIINYLINNISLSNLLNKVINWHKDKKAHYICISNVHSCIESFKDKRFKQAHNSADLALADGRPIYWALKLLGSKNAEHLPGYYITDKICELANKKKIKIGFYGSTNENLKKIKLNLKKKYKKLRIEYIFSPPFITLSKLEDKKIISKINKSKVDVLFVCLGCPKQELWMHEHKKNLKCIMIGIGAVADFLSGNKILPNKLFEYLGLAWLIRLITEPRRLFWRYFSTNFLFLFLFFLQITGLKKFR